MFVFVFCLRAKSVFAYIIFPEFYMMGKYVVILLLKALEVDGILILNLNAPFEVLPCPREANIKTLVP